MKSNEHKLQVACFNWFHYQYPMFQELFFAIPNGGKRNIITATKLKAEGVKAGVLDSFLAIPRYSYCGFFIEFKAGKNKMTDKQKAFAESVYVKGYKVATVYTIEEFIKEINLYLK
jgi:hypothetical protein